MSSVNLLGSGLFVLAFLGLMLYFSVLTRDRGRIRLRSISAFARLQRGIGMAVEAGQRLHVSLGDGGIIGPQGASALIGLSVLQRVARDASISDFPPVATSGEAVQAFLSQNTLRNAYRTIGAEDQYDPASGQLSGLTPFSFASGAVTTIYDQNVSVNVLAGSFGSEVALIAEAAERNNGITLAGSEHITAQAVLYAAVQEPLIGEELFASGAYMQAGPMHLASVRAQDILRWVLVGVILVGAILKLLNVL